MSKVNKKTERVDNPVNNHSAQNVVRTPRRAFKEKANRQILPAALRMESILIDVVTRFANAQGFALTGASEIGNITLKHKVTEKASPLAEAEKAKLQEMTAEADSPEFLWLHGRHDSSVPKVKGRKVVSQDSVYDGRPLLCWRFYIVPAEKDAATGKFKKAGPEALSEREKFVAVFFDGGKLNKRIINKEEVINSTIAKGEIEVDGLKYKIEKDKDGKKFLN